jgi:hypothetical protein
MRANYLQSATKQFEYYKLLGDRTFAQLTEEELLWQYNDASNSIAVIVNHLWGNMKSRWTDFLTADGEKGMARKGSRIRTGDPEQSGTSP